MSDGTDSSQTVRGLDYRQLDPGTFDVRSRLRSNGNTSLVGHVFVEVVNSTVKVEHWALRPIFASPGSTQDMVVERRSVSHTSLAAFLDEMRGLEAQIGAFSYIRASCESFSSLPD